MAHNTLLRVSPNLIGRATEGIGGFVTSLLSGKLLAGIAAGTLLVMGFMLWTTTKQRDAARKITRDIGVVVAGLVGVDPVTFKNGQIIPTLRVIATDRDTARRERDNFRSAAARQSTAVIALGKETARQRLRADEAVQIVKTVTRERDVWITRAKLASTRTERLACEVELKQTEEVLDALYQNGF